MEDRNYIMIDGVRCHADRPADCRFCRFWKNRRRGCILGRENCYYLAQVVITEEERKCKGCRYAVGKVPEYRRISISAGKTPGRCAPSDGQKERGQSFMEMSSFAE